METYVYQPVPSANGTHKEVSWILLLRQMFVSSSVWTNYFTAGFCIGSTTVVVPQLRKEANSAAAVSDEMASWLSCCSSYASLPWVLILPLLARLYGRRASYVLVCISAVAGFTSFYCSSTFTQLIISYLILGMMFAVQYTLSLIIITEYTSPRYRGVFLTVKSASFFWGIWVSNAIGTFAHWKYIGLCGIVCSAYAMCAVAMSPESPVWLASRGRFSDCSAAHRWLKGSSEGTELELCQLINLYSKDRSPSLRPNTVRLSEIKLLITRTFWKPLLLCFSVIGLYQFSGKIVCSIYIIDIIKKMSKTEAAAYEGMLILDGITVATMYVGCGLSKCLKRRTQLLVSSTICVLFLLLTSFYLFLVKLSIIAENKYISISLLMAFSAAVCCGPMILCTSISAEMIPLKARNLSFCVIGSFTCLLQGTLIKIGPYIFQKLSLSGGFLFYGLCSLCIIVIVYVFVPETKDKTLHEIQNSINK